MNARNAYCVLPLMTLFGGINTGVALKVEPFRRPSILIFCENNKKFSMAIAPKTEMKINKHPEEAAVNRTAVRGV